MRIIVFLLSLVVLGCGSENTAIKEASLEGDDGFSVFYAKFHSDSVFQMEHINFPLQGIPANAQDVEDLSSFRWTEDNWVMHREFDEKLTGYDRMLTPFGKDIVIEKIVQRDTQIGMVRRFAFQNGEWMLIYYAAMNPMPEGG